MSFSARRIEPSAVSAPLVGPAAPRPYAVFALGFGAAVFAAVLCFPGVLGDSDTLWHIAVGDWILRNAAVPVLDTFSFTAAGHPWAAHEWLAEVLLALAYRADRWNGVMVLTAAAAGSTAGVLAFGVRRRCRADVAAALVLLALACGGSSLLARPHLLALPCAATWIIGLVAARARRSAPSPWLLPLMTAWANLHGGFLLGVALAGALGLEAILDAPDNRGTVVRRWGGFLLAAIAAGTVTPHGIDGLLFPFRLMSMRNLYQIQEWRPSDLGHLGGVTVSILLALYAGLTGALRLPKFRALLLAVLVFATMQHARYMQLFGIIAPLLVVDYLAPRSLPAVPGPTRVRQWLPPGVAATGLLLILSLRAAHPVALEQLGRYPVEALARVPADLRGEPVLNDYYFGGLLIFNGIRPFVDGRADLYGDEFLDRYLAVIRGKTDALEDVLCRYGVRWTVLSPDTAVPALMDRMRGWRRLYGDGIAVIHILEQPGLDPTCSAPGGGPQAAGAPTP